ncbi:MAG: hypothetical protein KDD11_21755 [Acidobacteria bacterium]|nr:hypothetical protein [Acidobacteriota bacterium]
MTPNEYLNRILEQQTFKDDDQELKDLRQRRDDIRERLLVEFSSSAPSIRWAGSMAKKTMIREAYDGDMTCYFEHDETSAGSTLKELYEATEKALRVDFQVERKTSALRVRAQDDWTTDLHIDVVPGRFTTDDRDDVFLYQAGGEKERLKTNLETHIEHIRDSGVREAVRLMKLWRTRNGIDSAKTFVLELLVVKLLQDHVDEELPSQLEHVWTEFRDRASELRVEDPANSNNDLKPLLDACRSSLQVVAEDTLWQIENQGWEAVFGEVDDVDDQDKRESLVAAAAAVTSPTRPWLEGS